MCAANRLVTAFEGMREMELSAKSRRLPASAPLSAPKILACRNGWKRLTDGRHEVLN